MLFREYNPQKLYFLGNTIPKSYIFTKVICDYLRNQRELKKNRKQYFYYLSTFKLNKIFYEESHT